MVVPASNRPEEHNDGADLSPEEKITISTVLKALGNDKYKVRLSTI